MSLSESNRHLKEVSFMICWRSLCNSQVICQLKSALYCTVRGTKKRTALLVAKHEEGIEKKKVEKALLEMDLSRNATTLSPVNIEKWMNRPNTRKCLLKKTNEWLRFRFPRTTTSGVQITQNLSKMTPTVYLQYRLNYGDLYLKFYAWYVSELILSLLEEIKAWKRISRKAN